MDVGKCHLRASVVLGGGTDLCRSVGGIRDRDSSGRVGDTPELAFRRTHSALGSIGTKVLSAALLARAVPQKNAAQPGTQSHWLAATIFGGRAPDQVGL